MLYITALLLIISGILSIAFSLKRRARLNKIFHSLDVNLKKQPVSSKINEVSQVENVLKRTNRLVSLTVMLDKNIMAKAIAIVVSILLLFFIDNSGIYSIEMDIMVICTTVIVMLVILLPNMIKNAIIKKRMKNIANDFPFIIDMMAVCVQSGMTVEKSLNYIAGNTHNINPDIAVLLERTMLKAEVSGIGAALEQLYKEVASNEVRMFCSTLQQSIKYGSSIYQVLLDLSKEMRTVQLLIMEEKVASLSAKMTLPMIAFIMFPLLVIVAGPGLIGMMSAW